MSRAWPGVLEKQMHIDRKCTNETEKEFKR